MKVLNNTDRVLQPRCFGASVTLLPGANDVDGELWVKVKDSKFVQRRLGGAIVEIEAKKGGRKGKNEGITL